MSFLHDLIDFVGWRDVINVISAIVEVIISIIYLFIVVVKSSFSKRILPSLLQPILNGLGKIVHNWTNDLGTGSFSGSGWSSRRARVLFAWLQGVGIELSVWAGVNQYQRIIR